MSTLIQRTFVLSAAALLCSASAVADPPAFATLVPLPAPRIVASAEDYPGGGFTPEKLLDGDATSAFATNGKGTDTFVEFDFGQTVRVAAFRHVDRNDPATVAVSQLTLFDGDGKAVATPSVKHVNKPGGTTFFALPQPIDARRVRWQVTEVGNRHTTVGGAEITFFTAGEPESLPQAIGVQVRAVSIVERTPAGNVQPLELLLDYPYATPIEAVVRVEGFEPQPIHFEFGTHRLRYTTAAIDEDRPQRTTIEYDGQTVVSTETTLKPARKTTIYILPHSHTDIGYTQLQTEIEDKQVTNLLQGIQYARKTADNPAGARFVWNVEVLWAADLFLQRLGEPQQKLFFEAVKNGQIELCGMYLNELTGLCRPEELMRLFHYAKQLERSTGVPMESAMISDVPGYTWGTVSAMAQAGIKYFSVAPNYFARVGDILVQWENKPFYWIGPSGNEKVLVWIPYRGYATSHIIRSLTPEFLEQYQTHLDENSYPYEIAYLRWAGHGDNAVPDPAICDFVKDWNAKYQWPRLIISGTTEAFRALESRYGDQLPTVRGDWTPYWEDGAGSSAAETAINRASSDRLAQAEALWAIQSPATYPAEDFQTAWRNVLLYSEHTWGAWCSVSQPLGQETRDQWQIKQSYALAADTQSRENLSRALALQQQGEEDWMIDVFNSNSWPRTDLVVVPKHLCEGRDRVLDEQGVPLPSQRLRSGDLVVLARDVPSLATRRYSLVEGAPHVEGTVTVGDATLDNGLLHVRLDNQTGAIIELTASGLKENLVDLDGGEAVNDYRYLLGDDSSQIQRNGPARISIHERGPLVASLLVESDAPGCFQLTREIRLAAGLDYVELVNLVDKKRLVADNYYAKNGKESVNFAFPFKVPDGQVRLHVPFGVIQPDKDQIPSACKNWFTVGSWADVSNADFGVTCVTVDSPLVEVGSLSATLLNSQNNPDTWRKEVGPTQRFYAWVMNNHWDTNYRAYQEGPVVFRFLLQPHGPFDPAGASRLAIGRSQPLLPAGARGNRPSQTPRLVVDPTNVLVTGIKPSDDGKGIVVRLWEAAGHDTQARIEWSAPAPRQVWISDLSEMPRKTLEGTVPVPAWSVVTLRADIQ